MGQFDNETKNRKAMESIAKSLEIISNYVIRKEAKEPRTMVDGIAEAIVKRMKEDIQKDDGDGPPWRIPGE